jgi:hypothetical protein
MRAMITEAIRNHPLRQRRLWMPLAAVLVVVNLPFLHHYLRGAREVTQAVPFQDTFDRAAIGDDYWSNGGLWRIVEGHLFSPGVGNNALWLKARLPDNARISFDTWSEGPNGDIKVEAWGDGRNFETGYIFIFGAARNAENRLAKLDQQALTVEDIRIRLAAQVRPFPVHTTGIEGAWDSMWQPYEMWRAQSELDSINRGTYFESETPFAVRRPDPKVTRGQRYHMVITKQGEEIRWELDGQLLLQMHDARPLGGKGHDRFGFSSWQNDTYFDNLQIEGL